MVIVITMESVHDERTFITPRITSGELQPFLIFLIPHPVSDVILSDPAVRW